ncbi:MAG: hypothetical protein LBS99_03075 [Clostridiales bacterium]|jgi:hypothetical protein|nr:hypothetical protein [Clostridiales bacterium]
MANSRYVEIVIRDQTAKDKEKKKPVSGESQPLGGDNDGQGSAGGGISESRVAAAKALMAYNRFGKPYIQQIVSHDINMTSLQTGAEELQQREQHIYSLASQAFDMGESIAVGALTGGVWGAVAGALLNVAGTVFTHIQKVQTVNTEKTLESLGMRLTDERAGGGIASSGSR